MPMSTFILRCALALGLVPAACGDSDHEDATTNTEDVAQEVVHELTIEVEGSGKMTSCSLPSSSLANLHRSGSQPA